MRAATKVMPPLFSSWLMISEADVGIMTVQVKLPPNIPLRFVAM